MFFMVQSIFGANTVVFWTNEVILGANISLLGTNRVGMGPIQWYLVKYSGIFGENCGILEKIVAF